MSRIRESLNQLPSWPGFVIATAVAIGLGGWYYGTAYARCSALEQDRARLKAAIKAAASTPDAMLDLASTIPGDWNEVRIVQGHRPAADQRPLDCPFGWDFSAEERQALIDRGDYTLIGFFRNGEFQRYIEFRRDWAQFEADTLSAPRDAARLKVTAPVDGGGPYRLSHTE